jgi:hypothetical protein
LHSHPSKNSSRHQQPSSPPRFLHLWFSHDSFISSQGVGAIPMAELTSLPRALFGFFHIGAVFPCSSHSTGEARAAKLPPMAPLLSPWRPLQARQQKALLLTAAPSIRRPYSRTRRAPWRPEIFPAPPYSSSLPCCCSPLPPFP